MIEFVRGTNMSSEMENYEMIGRIDKNHHLIIDGEVPFEPGEVKVIVTPAKKEDKRSKADRFNSFRGALKGWNVDGLEFQKELRKEWDDR